MIIKIENKRLYDPTYVEDIIKKNIKGVSVTSADLLGNIKVKRGNVLAEIQYEMVSDIPFVNTQANDSVFPQPDISFLEEPVLEVEEEHEKEGLIEITSEVKTSYWIRFIILAVLIIPFNLFYIKMVEVSTLMKILFYIIAFALASIPEEIKKSKYAKGQKELKKMLVDLINEYNQSSSIGDNEDDDNKYELLPEE